MPACIESRGLPKSQALIEAGGVIGDPVKFCTFRIFACAPCKFPLSANARSGFLGWGWGGGGWGAMTCTGLAHMFDATQLYLHTCSMLRNCTCAHVRCYAILHLRTCSMLRNCTCAHVRCYEIALACAGTQCIDRFWQGLDDFIPASVVNKKQGNLNSRLLTYVYSYMWRYHLPADVNFQMKLGQLAKKAKVN